MPGITSATAEENKSKLKTLMGFSQDGEGYSAVIEGTFGVNEIRQEQHTKIRNRLAIKDYGITTTLDEEDTAILEKERKFYKKEYPEWLLTKIVTPYSDEYIRIIRKKHISTMLEEIDKIKESLGDPTLCKMFTAIFFNEITDVYKTFLETKQDEHFLTVINLIEDILKRNEINKQILKECHSLLKDIRNKDDIEFNDYENAVGRFFEIGIDMVSIEEKPDEK